MGATWFNGNVVGDAVLGVAARLVAASGLTVIENGNTYGASLRTVHGAGVALMRALDEIESARITAPAGVPSLSFGGN